MQHLSTTLYSYRFFSFDYLIGVDIFTKMLKLCFKVVVYRSTSNLILSLQEHVKGCVPVKPPEQTCTHNPLALHFPQSTQMFLKYPVVLSLDLKVMLNVKLLGFILNTTQTTTRQASPMEVSPVERNAECRTFHCQTAWRGPIPGTITS